MSQMMVYAHNHLGKDSPFQQLILYFLHNYYKYILHNLYHNLYIMKDIHLSLEFTLTIISCNLVFIHWIFWILIYDLEKGLNFIMRSFLVVLFEDWLPVGRENLWLDLENIRNLCKFGTFFLSMKRNRR